jgi:hypothetical protein
MYIFYRIRSGQISIFGTIDSNEKQKSWAEFKWGKILKNEIKKKRIFLPVKIPVIDLNWGQ